MPAPDPKQACEAPDFGGLYTATTSPDGVVHPIRVLRPVAAAGGVGLDAQILVGGSNMVRRPIIGAWKITMELDDDRSARAETTLDFGMMP